MGQPTHPQTCGGPGLGRAGALVSLSPPVGRHLGAGGGRRRHPAVRSGSLSSGRPPVLWKIYCSWRRKASMHSTFFFFKWMTNPAWPEAGRALDYR